MDKQKASRILAEYKARKLNQPKWLDPRFITQNAFINDPAKLKAAQCTRRAGKSYGCGLYLFKEAYETPRVDVLYIGLTRDAAKRVMFNQILGKINRELNLKAKPNVSDLTYTLPNQSTIKLLGVDAKPDDMNKLLGGKYKLVIIDEAAFYRQDMRKLIYEVLDPATADLDGTIAIISTTSDMTNSLYYDITNSKELGWSVHKWTAADNPFMKDQIAKKTARMIKANPLVVNTPMYKRMYLNQWYVDTDALIYKFNTEVNVVEQLPDPKGFQYILGVDLGWDDATAFTIGCYHPHNPVLYIVETFKQSKMTFDTVAEKIQEYDKTYDFQTMVIDNASKQGVESMRARYDLPLIAAEKHGKRDYIGLMNASFIQGKIKLLSSTTEDLQEEYRGLIWDPRKRELDKWVEHAGCDNHLCDSTLYMWRWAYNYAWEAAVPKVEPTSLEAVDEWWDRQGKQLESKQNEQSIDDELFGNDLDNNDNEW